MKGWQIIAAAVLYAWASWDFLKDRGWADGGAWFCYALANVFFALKAAGWMR